MKILAIDTSTSLNSVSILSEERVLVEHSTSRIGSHNRYLLKNIDLCLNILETSSKDLDGIAVSLGPGSFTGLRIGLSTAKTLAWTLDVPLVGIPTLDALALNVTFTSHLVCPLIDARKSEVYCALYVAEGQVPERITDFMVVHPLDLANQINRTTIFVGNGWNLYGSVLRDTLGDKALSPVCSAHLPRAGNVGTLAIERIRSNRLDDPFLLKPIYVRASDAEINLGKKQPT